MPHIGLAYPMAPRPRGLNRDRKATALLAPEMGDIGRPQGQVGATFYEAALPVKERSRMAASRARIAGA